MSGFWCLFQNCAAVDHGDSSKEKVLGFQGLWSVLRVQTKPEEGIATCPKTEPKAAPESKDFPLPKEWGETAKAGNLQS